MIHPLYFKEYPLKETLKHSFNYIRTRLRRKGYKDITANELETKLNSGEELLIIDCRNPKVFKDIGHIKGALNHPIKTFMETYQSIPKGTQIVTVCYFGFYCQTAAQELAKQGHKNVLSMKGGMETWIMSNKPIVKGVSS